MRAAGGVDFQSSAKDLHSRRAAMPDLAPWLGLALKIEDGDDHRARPTVVIDPGPAGVLTDERERRWRNMLSFPSAIAAMK